MIVFGVDLSGPSNIRETSLCKFMTHDDTIHFVSHLDSASDAQIIDDIASAAANHDVVVGLDAPLSYGSRGGDRECDAELRQRIIQVGMRPGSVMAPTAPRMVYLTLRGLRLATSLVSIRASHKIRVVEVHPGASMGLRGAPLDAVMQFKRSAEFRATLLGWLQIQGAIGIPREADCSDHFVASNAAALASWKWSRGEAVWLVEAKPPDSLFDFAC